MQPIVVAVVNSNEVIVAALIALVSFHQEPTITLESPGITVKALCVELERQTSRRIRAWDEIRNNLLAVRLNKAPLLKVLQEVAFAVRAKLDVDGAGFDIRPDPVAVAKTNAELLAWRIRYVRSLMQELRATVQANELDPAEALKAIAAHASFKSTQSARTPASVLEQEGTTFGIKSPGHQALARMFCSIPAEEIAKIRPGDTEVWSTSPTPVEHPLPPEGGRVLGQLRADSQTWNAAFSRSPAANEGSEREFDAWPAAAETAVIRLEIRSYYFGGYSLTFDAYDAHGAVVEESGHQFMAGGPSLKQDSNRVLPSVRLPGTGGIAADIWFYGTDRWQNFPPTEAEKQAFASDFFHPETSDPVSEVLGRALLLLANAEDAQLVAAEDARTAFFLDRSIYSKHRLDLDRFRNWLKQIDQEASPRATRDVDFSDNAGWMVVRPCDTDQCADFEADRAALGLFLRTVKQTEVEALGVGANFRGASGHLSYLWDHWTRQGLYLLVPGVLFASSPVDNYKRFVGLLGGDQIRAAQGRGLPLALCSEAALAELWRDFGSGFFINSSGQGGELSRRTTRAVPVGLPGGGILRVTTKRECWYRVFADDKIAGGGLERVDDLITRLGPLDGKLGQFDQAGVLVRPLIISSYTLEFEFPEGVSTNVKFNDPAWAGPTVKSLEELPAAFQSDIHQAVERKLGAHGPRGFSDDERATLFGWTPD